MEKRRPTFRQEMLAHQGLTPLSSGISTAISFGIFGLGMFGLESHHIPPLLAMIPSGATALLTAGLVRDFFRSDDSIIAEQSRLYGGSSNLTISQKIAAGMITTGIAGGLGALAAYDVHQGLDAMPFLTYQERDFGTLLAFSFPPAAAVRRSFVTRKL